MYAHGSLSGKVFDVRIGAHEQTLVCGVTNDIMAHQHGSNLVLEMLA